MGCHGNAHGSSMEAWGIVKTPDWNRRFSDHMGPNIDQTKPKVSGVVPASRHDTIPSDSVVVLKCFDHYPKVLKL